MTSSEIRSRFLKFFEERSHRVVRSSSLVPANDPTLLFSNAGMNQFKDVFLGRERRDYTRACSSQKCVRAGGKHNDLEQVGFTARHHTFFEMLGNFSFGDYFKKEAIAWAWELVTRDFGIPPGRLYATVFREDDEAEEIWANSVGVPRARIFRFDEKDNFWAMGDTGPCGPCSEIHYDLGAAASEQGHGDCRFPCDCGRYVELWNLVFMQFNRDEQGNMTPLPHPSIDTGAGLERLATVLQGKLSDYETDLFAPLVDEAARMARPWDEEEDIEKGISWHQYRGSLWIIADHSRAATFLISEGLVPSNEGRGYVLRKILRRAIRHGRLVGVEGAFLWRMVHPVRDLMVTAYPELTDATDRIVKIIRNEEVRFSHTLEVGLRKFEELRQKIQVSWRERVWREYANDPEAAALTKSAFHAIETGEVPGVAFNIDEVFGHEKAEAMRRAVGKPTLKGTDAFKLYDTFGLPLDFIEDACRDADMLFDRNGFDVAMAEQRERARASWKGTAKPLVLPAAQKLLELGQPTTFEGYSQTKSERCQILEFLAGNVAVPPWKASPGEKVDVILDRTPFYAEAGGQVGDTGWLYRGGRVVAEVYDTYSPVAGVVAHRAKIREDLEVTERVDAVVDAERRDSIRRNHTATHLLHAALRKTLGTHVKQAGSLVAPDRLRFDFTHYAALDEQDLLDIEDLVNGRVLANEAVETQELELDAAVNSGAMALFGEKYADQVRVVSVSDFSKELCGGTHVRRTGDIGLFKLVSESSVAAGTRRIEALTGEGVLKHLRQASETLGLLAETLRAKPDELLQAVEKLTESEKKLRKQLESQQMKHAAAQAGDLLENAVEVKGVRVIAARVEATDRAAMRQMVDNLRPRLGSGVIVLGAVADEKVSLVAAVSSDLTSRLDAGKIVKAAAAIVEGSGGGRKDLAEAGGRNPAKLDESLRAAVAIIEKML
jgi:alanyl-tRNA synthetase